MRKFKKFAAILMAATMTLAMAMSAMAAPIKVDLAGSFTEWATGKKAMTKGDNDIWSITVSLEAGDHEMKVVLDDEDWLPDGMGNNFTFNLAAAGDVTVYFKEGAGYFPYTVVGDGVTIEAKENDDGEIKPEVEEGIAAVKAYDWVPAGDSTPPEDNKEEETTKADDSKPADSKPDDSKSAGTTTPAKTGDATPIVLLFLGIAAAAIAIVARKRSEA